MSLTTPLSSTLKHRLDSFDGVIIDSAALPNEELDFAKQLQESLKAWKQTGKKGVWLKIPREKSYLIPVAIELGFDFHHANVEYCMLTKWLPSTTNKLPLAATHTIGVGAIVVNDKKEILVVKEKNGLAKQIWKIPGGRVDPGEEISDAAIREVLEETGIRTVFQSLICFRQVHNTMFGSDIYFVVLLKPITSEIRIQEDEISECKWMKLDEFLALPYYSQGVYREILNIGKEALENNYSGYVTSVHPLAFRPGDAVLYSSTRPKL